MVRIGGVSQDVTALKEASEALAAAEQRQRLLLEGIPQLVWRGTDGGHWSWASPQWTAYTGQAEAESHGFGWLATLHPEDREAARIAWEQATGAGGFRDEYRIRRAENGEYRWFQTRATPVRDAEGRIVEWLGTSTDIHDLRELQDRQRVLVAELQHRTRNLIAVIRSTAERTLRASTDLAEFREAFGDRLAALARVQGLLSRLEANDRVSFDELIGAEMEALDGAAPRVTLEGPAGVRLRSSTVQMLAMALHELATNALKYGALGQPEGQLAVRWRVEAEGPDGQPWLHIDWQERGVSVPRAGAPSGAPPDGGGEGRALIERALPYQLSARTTYVIGPEGVHCTIALPVPAT
ncbi:sensor histidine kinase [Roseomonas elaeocarpi]|uniref:histidine kinase n=1 Tax=Roseomonas elaeocarpi TaxID=907779 RepID=A0ABV6JUK1_9PROT